VVLAARVLHNALVTVWSRVADNALAAGGSDDIRNVTASGAYRRRVENPSNLRTTASIPRVLRLSSCPLCK